MPVIKVYGIGYTTENILEKMVEEVTTAVVSIAELGLNNSDVTVFFPIDQQEFAVNRVIVIEISGLYKKPERTPEVRNNLAKKVGQVIGSWLPGLPIECFVYSFNPEQGFWSSNQDLHCTQCGSKINWDSSVPVEITLSCGGSDKLIGYPCTSCRVLHEKTGEPIIEENDYVVLES